MERKIKKIWWYDITPETWKIPQKPYKQYLTKCWTIGYVKKDKDCVIVEYSSYADENGDRKCFDAIPKACIISIDDIK